MEIKVGDIVKYTGDAYENWYDRAFLVYSVDGDFIIIKEVIKIHKANFRKLKWYEKLFKLYKSLEK